MIHKKEISSQGPLLKENQKVIIKIPDYLIR